MEELNFRRLRRGDTVYVLTHTDEIGNTLTAYVMYLGRENTSSDRSILRYEYRFKLVRGDGSEYEINYEAEDDIYNRLYMILGGNINQQTKEFTFGDREVYDEDMVGFRIYVKRYELRIRPANERRSVVEHGHGNVYGHGKKQSRKSRKSKKTMKSKKSRKSRK